MKKIFVFFQKYLIILLLLICAILSLRNSENIIFATKNVILIDRLDRNDYYNGSFKKTTINRSKLQGYKQFPMFISENKIFDQYLNIIENYKLEKTKELIEIKNMSKELILLTYNAFKNIKLMKVLKIVFIDNRRANVYVKYKNKDILIISNVGEPNIKKLLKWNEKYGILDRMTIIDLRFDNLMVIHNI